MTKSKRKRTPKTVLKLPDLEQSKSPVLNSLTSTSSKRSYEHAFVNSSTAFAPSSLAYNKAGRIWGYGFTPKVILGNCEVNGKNSGLPTVAPHGCDGPVYDSSWGRW